MTERDVVTIVSGLPRSGTSMMMRMLAAGGVEALTDNLRAADEDNPRGYLEFERVKALEHDSSWLSDAAGKSVKIISALLKHLPREHSYKIIFMRRKMGEILSSQKQMIVRSGGPAEGVSDERLAEMFERHLRDVQAWLAGQPNIEVVYVDYNELLSDPAPALQTINHFLGGRLDTRAMASVIDKTLYRQRDERRAGAGPPAELARADAR